MTHKEQLINAYLSDDSIGTLGQQIDCHEDISDADALAIIEQVIATVWYKL